MTLAAFRGETLGYGGAAVLHGVTLALDRGERMGPDPAPGDHAAAPLNPRRKRRREDSGPAPSSPEFRILATKWQYRGTTTA